MLTEDDVRRVIREELARATPTTASDAPIASRPRKPKTGQPWDAETARKVWRMILEGVYTHV